MPEKAMQGQGPVRVEQAVGDSQSHNPSQEPEILQEGGKALLPAREKGIKQA